MFTYSKYFSFCMGAMVRLGHHALKPENTSCYIGVIFGTVLIQEKRSFDRLMNTYVQAIGETRPHRKAKLGILAFVAEFEVFTKTRNPEKYFISPIFKNLHFFVRIGFCANG